ncbi:MAG: response regulator [bacterium]|nr:response regulator [bacterium]
MKTILKIFKFEFKTDYFSKFSTKEIFPILKYNFLIFFVFIGLIGTFFLSSKYLFTKLILTNFLVTFSSFILNLLLLFFLIRKKKVEIVGRILVYFLFFVNLFILFFTDLESNRRIIVYIFPLISFLSISFWESFILSFIVMFFIIAKIPDYYDIFTYDRTLNFSFLITYISIFLITAVYKYFLDMFQKIAVENEERLDYENKVLKVLKENFQKKNSEFQKLFEVVPSAVFITDKNGKIISINRRALEILGYKEDELVGKECTFFALEPCRSGCSLKNKNDDTPILNKICKIVTSSKNIRIISKNAQILKDENGNYSGSIEVFDDITEKYNYEREIEKLMFSVNQSPASVVITDTDGNIEYVNKKFTEVTGYTFEEVKGKNPRILKSGEKSKEEYKELWDTIKSGKEWRGEFHNKRKDGTLYWEMALIAPIIDKDGKIINFVAVKEDITERKKVENELFEAKLKAEQATKAKSIFLANMNHEIRTPLNGIVGMVDLLLGTKLDKEQEDFVKTIKYSSITLLTLINDILDFSKIESGKMSFEEIEFDLYQLVELSLKPLIFEVSKKGLEVLVDIDRNVPRYIKSDPVRLKQIILNLVGNSLKFTEKGEILVEVKLLERRENDVILKFIISDSGIGIDNDKIEKIFQPFEQADNSITRKFGGTGLGTSISKYIVEKLGGQIYATSPSKLSKDGGRGRGSEFGFTIKTVEVSADDIKKTFSKIKDIEKVLVIDDNKLNLKIMQNMLSVWNVDCETLTTFKGFDKDLKNYDLIFVDYVMPDFNGLEVAKMIKERDEKIKVVIFTSAILKEDKEKFDSIGVDGYLQKPVTQSSLYDLLASMFEEREKIVEKKEKKKNLEKKDVKILVAEDNPVNQKVAKSMLNKLGYDVDIAENGTKVLEKMSENSYDIILMDVQMPVMDGLTTTRIIREVEDDLKNHRNLSYNLNLKKIPIPIIALTANAMKEDRDICLANGMNDYLSKPLNLNELKEVVEKYSGS